MMIMVTPTEAQGILPALLDLACPVARFPVGALFCEEKVAGDVRADESDRLPLDL